MTKPVIFLGPSLPQEEAREFLDADYRPPVKRGDLQKIPFDTSIVGIIDGVIMNEAAVGHREILGLIKRGLVVLGGGSMGALRAYELESFGMKGVGVIFDHYRRGDIDGDDEVVLMYDPHTLAAISEPLINLRLNIIEAKAKGSIRAEQSESLIKKLKETYFPERSYEILFQFASEMMNVDDYNMFKDCLESQKRDFKKEDAISVLLSVKSLLKKSEK